MNIAFVGKAYTPYGGADRYLSQVMERLRTQGHEVYVLAHRWNTDQGDGDPRLAGFAAELSRESDPCNPCLVRDCQDNFCMRQISDEEVCAAADRMLETGR